MLSKNILKQITINTFWVNNMNIKDIMLKETLYSKYAHSIMNRLVWRNLSRISDQTFSRY